MSNKLSMYNIYELRKVCKNKQDTELGLLVKASNKIEARLIAHESEEKNKGVWLNDHNSQCTLVGHIRVDDQPDVFGWRHGPPFDGC